MTTRNTNLGTRRWTRLALAITGALLVSGFIVPGSEPATAGASPEVVLIGDSLVGGNRVGIDPVFAASGLEVHIDARSGRNLTDPFVDGPRRVDSGVAAAARLRDQGLRPALWLIALGANDVAVIRRCECDDPVAFAGERIDALLAELPRDANVAWVTVHRVELEPAVTHFNNALLLRSLQQIDWHAAALFRDEWFLDARHPSVAGVRAYANVLADGMATYLDGPFRGERSARRLGLVAYPTSL